MWLDRLERELNNLRAALQWAIEKGEAGEGMETALRLAGALLWFWTDRRYASEALTALKRALASSQGAAPVVRAKALFTAGVLADDHEQINALLSESLAIFQELGDTHGMALSLFWLGMLAETEGSIAEAHQLIEEALALFKQVGDQVYIAWAYARFATQLNLQGEYARARALREENLRRFREQGDMWGTASTLSEMGWSLFLTGDDPALARSLLQEGLALAREMGIFFPIVQTLSCLAELALAQEDAAGARSLIEEVWVFVPDRGYQENRARLLFLSGQVAAMEGNYAAAYAYYKESLAGIEKSYIPPAWKGRLTWR